MLACFAACTSSQKEEKQSSKIGKYVYLDAFKLHTDRNCYNLASSITFLDTADVTQRNLQKCAHDALTTVFMKFSIV